MSLLPDFIISKIFNKMKVSCKQMARIELDSINTAELAKNFPNLPLIYIYSSKDEFISSTDSMFIFSKLRTEFKLFLDCQVSHNQNRPEEKTNKVFHLLKDLWKKYERKKKRVQMKKQNRRLKRSRSGLQLKLKKPPLKLASKKVLFENQRLGKKVSGNKIQFENQDNSSHQEMLRKKKFLRSRKKNMSMGNLRSLREKIDSLNQSKDLKLPKKLKSRKIMKTPNVKARGISEKPFQRNKVRESEFEGNKEKLQVILKNRNGKKPKSRKPSKSPKKPPIQKSFLSQKEKNPLKVKRNEYLNNPYRQTDLQNDFEPSNSGKNKKLGKSIELQTAELDTKIDESFQNHPNMAKILDPNIKINFPKAPNQKIETTQPKMEAVNYFSVNSHSNQSQNTMTANPLHSLKNIQNNNTQPKMKLKPQTSIQDNGLDSEKFKRKNFPVSQTNNVVVASPMENNSRAESHNEFRLPIMKSSEIDTIEMIQLMQTDSNKNINTSTELRNHRGKIHNRKLVNPQSKFGTMQIRVSENWKASQEVKTSAQVTEMKTEVQKKRISERISQNLKYIQQTEEMHQMQVKHKQKLTIPDHLKNQNRFVSPVRVNIHKMTEPSKNTSKRFQITPPFSPYLDMSHNSRMNNSHHRSNQNFYRKENSRLDSSFNSHFNHQNERKSKMVKSGTHDRFYNQQSKQRSSEIIVIERPKQDNYQKIIRGSSTQIKKSSFQNLAERPNTKIIKFRTPTMKSFNSQNNQEKEINLHLSHVSQTENKITRQEKSTPNRSPLIINIKPEALKTTEPQFKTFRENKRNTQTKLMPRQKNLPPGLSGQLKEYRKRSQKLINPKSGQTPNRPKINCFQMAKNFSIQENKHKSRPPQRKTVAIKNPKKITYPPKSPIQSKPNLNQNRIKSYNTSNSQSKTRMVKRNSKYPSETTRNYKEPITIDRISQNLMGLQPSRKPDLKNLVKSYGHPSKNYSHRSYQKSKGTHSKNNIYNDLIQKLARKP